MNSPAKLAVEKLDRSRAFGTVYGETPHNMAFTQTAMGIQGWPYDCHGELIEEALNEQQRAKLAERRAKAAQPAEGAPKQEAKAVPDDDDDLEEPDAPARGKPEDDEVNFEMWLRGEARYKPHELQAAGKRRYGVNKPKPYDLAVYLVEEKKLIPRNQVHPSILPPLQAA